MTAVAFVPSPTYGRTVALGPTQRAVYDVAMRLTRGGRRPELTLRRLSSLTGRPVSSVHDALGRLRALGVIGVSARPGRRGGHRLWRVAVPGSSAQLDTDRHRRAVARILRRFGAAIGVPRRGVMAAVPPERDDPPSAGPPKPTGDASPPPDPFAVRPADWTPAPRGASFTDRLRHHGLSADWIADHERLRRADRKR